MLLSGHEEKEPTWDASVEQIALDPTALSTAELTAELTNAGSGAAPAAPFEPAPPGQGRLVVLALPLLILLLPCTYIMLLMPISPPNEHSAYAQLTRSFRTAYAKK